MKLATLTEQFYGFILVKSLLCRRWNYDDTSIFGENRDSRIYICWLTRGV